jgi:hypothetical protein
MLSSATVFCRIDFISILLKALLDELQRFGLVFDQQYVHDIKFVHAKSLSTRKERKTAFRHCAHLALHL